MSNRSWSEFRISFSQNTAWDLSSREHCWDLINFESILFLSSLIVCLSKTLKYLVFPSKWRVELTVWEVLFFPVPEKIIYSFFNVLFDILEQYKFGLYITGWKRRFGFWLYFYLWKRVSLSPPPPPPPPLSAGRGAWASNQIFKKGVLHRTSTFRGGCWERGGWPSSGGSCNFHIKVNENLRYLMTKKVYKQKCFSIL